MQNIRVPRTPVEEYYISGGVYNSQDDLEAIIFQERIPLPDRLQELTMKHYT